MGVNLHRVHQRRRACVQPVPGKDARLADQRRLDTVQGNGARDVVICGRGCRGRGTGGAGLRWFDCQRDVVALLLPHHAAPPKQCTDIGDRPFDPGPLVGDKVKATAGSEHPGRASDQLLLHSSPAREVAQHQIERGGGQPSHAVGQLHFTVGDAVGGQRALGACRRRHVAVHQPDVALRGQDACDRADDTRPAAQVEHIVA